MSIRSLSYRETALKGYLNDTNCRFESKEEILACLNRNSFAKHETENKGDHLNAGGDEKADTAMARISRLFVGAPSASNDEQARYDFSDINAQALEHLTKRFPDLHVPLRDTTFPQFGVIVCKQRRTCIIRHSPAA
jgi:hypothetical protein